MSADEIDAEEFVKYLESEKIFVQAHGQVNNVLKMYLHSKELQGNNYYLTELILHFNCLEISFNIKSTNFNNSSKYEEYLIKIIEPIL
jgi:hypothetical protein